MTTSDVRTKANQIEIKIICPLVLTDNINN